ncbi:MAG: hypothetical protein QXD33_06685 [Nitrososphaerota archaeon]
MGISSPALIIWLAFVSLSIFISIVPISSSTSASWDVPETGHSWGLA